MNGIIYHLRSSINASRISDGPMANITENMSELPNEDETFKILMRIPFEDLIWRLSILGLDPASERRFIIDRVALGFFRVDIETWPKICGGWEYDDFEKECKKHHTEAYYA
jgi:hypothetical protein